MVLSKVLPTAKLFLSNSKHVPIIEIFYPILSWICPNEDYSRINLLRLVLFQFWRFSINLFKKS